MAPPPPDAPPPDAPPPDVPPRDSAALWAGVGSAVLAVPGAAGAGMVVFAATLLLKNASVSEQWTFGSGTLAALAAIGAGFALLAGYWRVWAGRMAAERRPRFWALSALYNGVGALAAAGVLAWWDLEEPGALAALGALTWTGWMVWIGLRRSVFARSR